jgi:anti-sigma factor RsiW
MSQCWQEGTWRAYLDGELPADEMVWGKEHLVKCAECAGLHRELSARAARVGALITELESAPEVVQREVVQGRRSSQPRRRWAVAGLALAAALAAAFVLAPKRVVPVPAPVRAGIPVTPAIEEAPLAPAPLKRPPARRVIHHRAPQLQYYLALDDEPIDTGTVIRVALASGAEADVIVDSEGKPRAIRAVR